MSENKIEEKDQKIEEKSKLPTEYCDSCEGHPKLEFTNNIDTKINSNGLFRCKICNDCYQRCEFGRFSCPKCHKNDVCWKCRPPERKKLIDSCLNVEHGPKIYIKEKKEGEQDLFTCILCHFEHDYYTGRFVCNSGCTNYSICRNCKLEDVNKIRQCKNHHSLYYVLPIAGSKEKFTCSNCNKFIYETEGRFTCSENCAYNICINCRISPKELMTIFPKCKEEKSEYKYITEFPKWEFQNKFYCSLCFKKSYIVNGCWYCEKCYNAICTRCRPLHNYKLEKKDEKALEKESSSKKCSYCNKDESLLGKGFIMTLYCGHYSLCFNCAKLRKEKKCLICAKLDDKKKNDKNNY